MKFVKNCRNIVVTLMLLLILLTISSCAKESKDFVFGNSLYELEESKEYKEIYVDMDKEDRITIDYKDAAKRKFYVEIMGEVYTVIGDESKLTVIYPDGKETWGSFSGNLFAGGGEVNRDVTVEELREIVFDPDSNPKNKSSEGNGIKVLVAIVFLIGGIIQMINPEFAFWLNRGWMFRNAEPSDTYLQITRVGGFLLTVVAGITFLTVIF